MSLETGRYSPWNTAVLHLLPHDCKRIQSIVPVYNSVFYEQTRLSTLPVLIVYPFLQKYFYKGVLIGSIKG